MIDLKEGIKMQIVVGKFITYSELLANDGYCFYDKNTSEDERQYYTSIKTPEKDVLVLKDQYVAVLGNADVLNDEVAKKLEQKMMAELEAENE